MKKVSVLFMVLLLVIGSTTTVFANDVKGVKEELVEVNIEGITFREVTEEEAEKVDMSQVIVVDSEEEAVEIITALLEGQEGFVRADEHLTNNVMTNSFKESQLNDKYPTMMSKSFNPGMGHSGTVTTSEKYWLGAMVFYVNIGYTYSYWYDTNSRIYKFNALAYNDSWITGFQIPVGTVWHPRNSEATATIYSSRTSGRISVPGVMDVFFLSNGMMQLANINYVAAMNIYLD